MKIIVAVIAILILPVGNAMVFIESFNESAALNDALFETFQNESICYVVFPPQNNFSNDRLLEYNATYGGAFLDGGYRVIRNVSELEDAIHECMERNKSIVVNISAEWMICPARKGLRIEVSVKSVSNYEGVLRIYIMEVNSRWKDELGRKYHFSFLEFASIKNISLKGGEEYYTSLIWSPMENYPDVIKNKNNIAVVAAIFNKEWHVGYAIPPDERPFKAHYLDGIAFYIPEDTPPYISIVYPRSGHIYVFGREIMKIKTTIIIGGIVVKIKTWDDHGIEKIELYKDGKFVKELEKNELEWHGIGYHSLEFIAYDANSMGHDSIKAFLI
ncbi:MAG: hypothetical protein FE045_03595 [Thermoplasmata archaeon]|nr:MAG: hypothetical protein FE045_03595 [Thermoplasmata archaeon]